MTHCGCDRAACANRRRTEGRPCCTTCTHTQPSPTRRPDHDGKPARCHWNGTERVVSEHVRGCDSSACDGCKPCTNTHCGMPRCNRHLADHEPRVCAKCVGNVRINLDRISQLCKWAPIVAASARSLSAAEVGLAGAVADPTSREVLDQRTSHDVRRRWAMGGALCRCPFDRDGNTTCPDHQPIPPGPECKKAEECTHHVCRRITGRPTCPELVAWLEIGTGDELHPRWVLAIWDTLVGEHLDHARTLRPTVGSAVAYITSNLTDLSRLEEFPFHELAAEVAACLAHVSTVLAIAPHTQRGAPCPVCHAAGRKAKQLERIYVEPTDEHPAKPDEQADARDFWICPRAECAQTWTAEEYDKYVEREHLKRADRLTASALAREYRVAEGSIRGWASLGKVRRRGHDPHGRTLYDVADTLAQRDRRTPAETA